MKRERRAKLKLTDPEKLQAKELAMRERRRKNNPEGLRAYFKAYRRKHLREPANRIRANLSRRISHYVRGESKNTMELLGCSLEDFQIYLSSRFLPGMSWENYGEWHIDHRFPCAIFDLTDSLQQKFCFHFSNLQPMWGKDNIRKGKKVSPQDAEWLIKTGHELIAAGEKALKKDDRISEE